MKKFFVVLLAFFLLLCSSGCSKKEEVYDRGNLFQYNNPSSSYYSTNWTLPSNVGKLDTSVDQAAAPKRTTIYGNGKDQITILVYMCGSDLESKGNMASYDLQEMANANLNDRVNLIVYTGGTTRWGINGISTKYNQIYKVSKGKLECLVDNAGSGSMVDPDTLLEFLEYGKQNFPANRMELILWDHGGGSVGGYGYDLKYPSAGSMTLAQLDEALYQADIDFDFIGFDACLMANTETALMLAEHSDYLIASEESEPGIGWYYTDWLTALCKNPAMPTIEIGKNIADSFVKTCSSQTPRQDATLSVIDLAQAKAVLSNQLSQFSVSTVDLINQNQYKTVASARSTAREFAQGSGNDLVDLVDLANRVGTKQAKQLVDAVLSCVKYNNTSSSISNAYGLSIYFPYTSTKYVNKMIDTYQDIHFNEDYASCIKTFATYQASGQVASGGQHSAYQSFNQYDTSLYQNQSSSDLIVDLIGAFLTSSQQPTQQQDPYAALFGFGMNLLLNSMFNKNVSDYIVDNHFDADLTFKNGQIHLTQRQWSMVDDLKLNVFIDDGEGYIDLGTDYIFEVDQQGNLLAIQDMTWIAASIDQENWQVVPYYYQTSIIDQDNIITYGTIPVLYNNQLADLLVYIDNNVMEVNGVVYRNYDSGVVGKTIEKLQPADQICFLADYYRYDGSFVDSYQLNDALIIIDDLYLGDISIDAYSYLSAYQFTDIYQQNYWTTPMKK